MSRQQAAGRLVTRIGRPFIALFALPAVIAAQETTQSPHGALSRPCAQCHAANAWRPAVPGKAFVHAPGRFPLTNAHAKASCGSCHSTLEFSRVTRTCSGCHRDVHRGEFGTSCARCHSEKSFLDLALARQTHQTSVFPLTGAHAAVACESCHRPRAPGQNAFQGIASTCGSCHLPDYQRTSLPPHSASGISTQCERCHTTSGWSGTPFDHARTQFPLTGAHAATACSSCHGDGVFRGKATTCVSCHQADFARTTSPPHGAASFSTSCAQCHSTTAWQGAPFDHSTTTFALTGAHRTATCVSCHRDNVYRGKPTACAACHQTQYDRTNDPPHAAAAFPATCGACHTTTAWRGAPFDHAVTRFPLTGAHRGVTCGACHGDGVYHGKPTACAACHRTQFDATRSPPHAASGFPLTCEMCHTTAAWQGSPFDHSTTRFPLVGMHRTATCVSCHADGVYRGKPTVCVSCHQPAYNSTTNPPHSAAAFPTTCETCHTPSGWIPAPFNHANTRFPLSGTHAATTCGGCHGDGVYHGKPTSCVACHQAAYNATTNPPHAAAAFGTTCEACHTPSAWVPAAFNHSNTRFPLTGAHTAAACAGCHGDGVYHGKPTTCVSCHQGNYTATTNPNHSAAHFPTDCASCHTTTAWAGARFDHDGQYFPIYSGAHRGRWSTCATCHTSPTNYAVFTCLTCHARTETDSHHREQTGYVYASSSCYACHPRGKA